MLMQKPNPMYISMIQPEPYACGLSRGWINMVPGLQMDQCTSYNQRHATGAKAVESAQLDA
jgi:hypothetical protein